MNTGVGDAVDLSWKLAAMLRGWGGPKLLDSYEIERRQIGDRNVGASRYASLGRRKWRSQYRSNIRETTPEGQATRDNLARIADVEQRKTNEMIGAELGYRYVGSPVIRMNRVVLSTCSATMSRRRGLERDSRTCGFTTRGPSRI